MDDEVEDFLDRHGDEIGVIVFMFNGKTPEHKGIVEFVAASERCLRRNGRLMSDDEFGAALKAFDTTQDLE